MMAAWSTCSKCTDPFYFFFLGKWNHNWWHYYQNSIFCNHKMIKYCLHIFRLVISKSQPLSKNILVICLVSPLDLYQLCHVQLTLCSDPTKKQKWRERERERNRIPVMRKSVMIQRLPPSLSSFYHMNLHHYPSSLCKNIIYFFPQ